MRSIGRRRGSETMLPVLLLVVGVSGASAAGGQERDPGKAVEELLAADRRFSTASARVSAVEGLATMFDANVEMRAPGGVFASGRDAVLAVLRANADNLTSRLQWRPVRGGISADGQHGFTVGVMTLTRPDSTRVHLKYLSYWILTREGWRVRLYRRSPRSEGEVASLAPVLPSRMVPASNDSLRINRYAAEVDSSERAFSDAARVIGLGPAFARFGSPDAMNIGPPDIPGFVIGADAIGVSVGAGAPPGGSQLSWAPDHVVVASSGDLGATVGYIMAPGTAGQPPARIPFFTIWRRARPGDPWRYIAE